MTAPTRLRSGEGSARFPTSPTPPTQALTFVFTDIEGSTRLLEQLHDRYAEVLAIHGGLIGDAAARADGEIVDTQGDAFFLAFRTADQAVAFAVDAQQGLAGQRWPADTELRVRMGIHSGKATPNAGGYVGLDVHRAARISSAAHGGQVLLSAEAARGLRNGHRLKALGAHQLKDFAAPINLHQLLIDGLPAEFAPPRSLEDPDQPPAPGEPPYQGLAHFGEADAARFFGREKLVARLVDRLEEHSFLAVIGASGSGKSSLVRAGLVPALRAKGVKRVVLLTPTAEPFAALAAALAPEAGTQERAELAQRLRFGPDALTARLGAGSLLVVDQAEELFSLSRDEGERSAFIERLLVAVTAGGYVVLTLRADFYDRLAGYPALRDLVAARQEYLGQMSSAELRAAIEGPAEAGGWRFDAGLVDLILHDVGAEPGALPLLSHALLETWQRRRGRLMMLRGYLESGGVQAAIARSADRLMAELQPEQQAIARTIFLRLTEFGAGTPDTRRRADLAELLGRTDDAGADILQRLAERRLVVIGEDTAEVAHEALIREWPTLREWLAADREALRLHRSLTEAASEWQRAGREPSLLFRGARLVAALDWAQGHATDLNDVERDFLAAGSVASEHEAQRQRRTNRRLRMLLAGAGVFLLLAIAAGSYAALEAGRAEQEAAAAVAAQLEAEGARRDAEQQATEAQQERDNAQEARGRAETEEARAEQAALDARARELTMSALAAMNEDPSLSKALLVAAAGIAEPSIEALELLHRATAEDRIVARYSWPEEEPIGSPMWVDLHPSGDLMLASPQVPSAENYMEVFDLSTGQRAWSFNVPHEAAALSQAYFTPNGKHVIVGVRWDSSAEASGAGIPEDTVGLRVLDARTGVSVALLDTGQCGAATGGVGSGRALVHTTLPTEAGACSWNPYESNPFESIRLESVDLASGTLQLVASRAPTAALSGDGRYVAYDDWITGLTTIVNLETGDPCEIPEPADQYGGRSWAMSHDGSLLLYGFEPLMVYDHRCTKTDRDFFVHAGLVNHAAFNPATETAYSTGRDGQLLHWDVRTGDVIERSAGVGNGSLAVNEAGTLLVGAIDTNTAALVRPTSGLNVRQLSDFWQPPEGAPDCFTLTDGLQLSGRLLLFTDTCAGRYGEQTTTAIDIASMTVRYSLRGAGGQRSAVAPDGLSFVRQEAFEYSYGPLMVRDVLTGAEVVELQGLCTYDVRPDIEAAECASYPDTPFAFGAWDVEWSPNGSMIAAASDEQGAGVWDAVSGELLAPVSDLTKSATSLMFTPNSEQLIVSYGDGSFDASSTETWAVIATASATGQPVTIAGFIDNGDLLAISEGGALHWIDPITLKPTRPAMASQHDGSLRATAISPSGMALATVSSDGLLRIMDAASGKLSLRAGFGSVQAKGVVFVDETRAAVALENGLLHVVTVDPAQVVDLARGSLTRSLTPSECERFSFEHCPTLDELRAP
jgi:class 3 adenylate cyclase/WD40 repeat protein